MRNFIVIILIYICTLHRNGSSIVIGRNGEIFPVYMASRGGRDFSASMGGKHPNVSASDVEVRGREGGVMNAKEEARNFNGKTNRSVIDYANVTDGLLMAQYERCLHSKGFGDCFKFKTLKFLKDLFQPITLNNFSDIARSLAMSSNEPFLIRLPSSNGTTQPVLANAVKRAFGSLGSTDIVRFVLEQFDVFLSRHGLMMNVKDLQAGEPVQLDSPWLINFEEGKDSRDGRKVKKKEYAIVFPMLVLFKFLKIKMLLVPILLGVIFLKKLLILTLTLLPYLIGLFGCCRRPPFLGPIQSAGLLQEIDTRGEFSTNLGYSFPYRDGFSFRPKDKGRPSDAYSDY